MPQSDNGVVNAFAQASAAFHDTINKALDDHRHFWPNRCQRAGLASMHLGFSAVLLLLSHNERRAP